MRISISFNRQCKAAAATNDNTFQICTLPTIEQYAVRGIARRARVSTAVALAIAEMVGITRGERHG